MNTCRERFESEGTLLDVAGNQPLHLDHEGNCWLVSEKFIDVFATIARDDESTAQRVHVCRIEAGELLVGGITAEEGLGLIAIGTTGSQVRQLPTQRLREHAADAEATSDVAGLLNRWISQLTTGIRGGNVPRDLKLLKANVDLRLAAGDSTSPLQVLWVTGDDVECEFLGEVKFTLGAPPLPLADAGWIRVADKLRVRAVPTEKVLRENLDWSGLAQLQGLIVRCAAESAAKAAAAEARRLHAKSEMEVETGRHAIEQLAAAVRNDDHAIEAMIDAGDDPTLAACRLVGQSAGISMTAPRNYADKKWSDPVTAIARASAVRTRHVVLAGKWWREENGPLLGFLVEGNHPVALLPARSGYEMVDPATRVATPVTDENRKKLQGGAYCFYRSFPPRRMTPKDIVQFGLRGTRRDWIMVLILGLLGAVLGLFVPIATGWIIGDIIPSGDRGQLLLLVMALSVNSIVMMLFGFCQGIAMLRLESRMDSSVEAGVWDRLLNVPASFFRDYTAGDLAMRAMGIGQIRQALTEAAMSSVMSFVFSFVSFGLLFYYDPRLAMFAVVLFIVMIIATSVGAYFQVQYERKNYELSGRVSGILLQLLTGISRLRVAGAENRTLAYWAKHYGEQTATAVRGQMVSNNLATFMSAIPIFSTLMIFGIVALYPPGSLSLSTFIAFSAAFGSVMASAVAMSSTVSTVLDVVPLYERSRPILDAMPEFHQAKRDPGELTGNIEIGQVSFRYTPDGPLVLDDVSVDIHPGEFVAFVGPSGAGKSTIFRLLLGFDVPETGSIYFDREDVSQLDRQAVRRQIGTVLQNGRLTSGDIFRNIVGSSTLTLEDAWEAARLSGLDADIKAMPMGMHTVLSDGESTLSGGQRQRLMIARAIVNKPAILLFDEATSALDNVTQTKVSQSLDALKSTRIVIAHRLSTIINADRICVLDRGKIVQQGSYEELMQQEDGLFADLAKRQLA